ncbi:hypothetical protein COOONC_12128, partial [Cooperia oncophora]
LNVDFQPISPLKYDPDDPSTFPPEEKPPKSSDKKADKDKKAKEKEKKEKDKKPPPKSQASQLRSAYRPPVGALREANDLETVNGMVSNWGAVQEPLPADNEKPK